MSGLRIYGIARTRAFRALWMAEELGLDYTHWPIEIGDAGACAPEFHSFNPKRPAARALRTKADNETPAEVTHRIAQINRL